MSQGQTETVQVPSIGRVVHYVLNDGRGHGQHRPAFIVRVWTDDMVNLQVFPDGDNDQPYECPLWVGSALRDDSESHEPGTWHFPEYVPAKRVDQ